MTSSALAGKITNDNSPDLLVADQGASFASENSSLVIPTESTSAQVTQTPSPPRKRDHNYRYLLQEAAKRLLPGERVSHCMLTICDPEKRIQVVQNAKLETAHYRNLSICGSPWMCPVCAARITEERRKELTIAVANSDYRVVLVTYTLRHKRSDKLKDVLDALKAAFGFMRSGRKWTNFKSLFGVVGAILATEVTYGVNGWHPHRHELVFLPGDITPLALEQFEITIKERWRMAVKKQGFDASWEHGVHVQSNENLNREYIAKWGVEPKNPGWSTIHELTKAPVKQSRGKGFTPFQLLEAFNNGDKRAGQLFREYALLFKHTRQLQYTDGLKELLGLKVKTDQEIVEEKPVNEDESVVYELYLAQWDRVVKMKLRGALLDFARNHTTEEIRLWLRSKGIGDVIKINLLDYWDGLGKDKPKPNETPPPRKPDDQKQLSFL